MTISPVSFVARSGFDKSDAGGILFKIAKRACRIKGEKINKKI